MNRYIMSVTTGIAALILLLPAGVVADDISGVDLSGRWKINTELSDDPGDVINKKMKEMRGNRGGAGGRGSGMRGGRGGMGGGRGGMGGGGRPPRESSGGGPNQEQMQQRFQPPGTHDEILILQEGDEVTMIYANRDTLSMIPDGKKRTRRAPTGEIEVEAEWEGLALHVKITYPQNPEITRHYRINDDGRLEVVSVVPLPRGNPTVEIVTVYDESSSDG